MKTPEQLNHLLAELAFQYIGGAEDVSMPLARGVNVTPSFRDGLHLGNDGAPPAEQLQWLLDAAAQHVLAMDNVGPEPLVPWANSAPDTVLVLRHHLPPGFILPGDVMNWANGAVEMIHRWVNANPVFRRMYDEGRIIKKVFNEPNLELQFGSNWDVGTYDRYNDYFLQAVEVIKRAFPNVKIAGLSLAPGNADTHFDGDRVNVHYWLHGPECAKPNATASDYAAAQNSCRIKEALGAMDYFGCHVYPLAGTWDKPWLGLRFTRYWKTLPQRLRANTLILEGTISDHGVPAGDYQRIRAEETILHLQKLAEYGPSNPEGTIKGRTGWWGKKGDPTWFIHEYFDELGRPRAIATAVRQFNAGATTPAPNPNPTPNPVPPTPAPSTVDFGIASEWVRVIPASPRPGQSYWKLVQGRFEDANQSGGNHHIYIESPRGNGQVAKVWNQAGSLPDIPLEKPEGEPAGNAPMFPGNIYRVAMPGLSDSVEGLTMPQNQHVNYRLGFIWVTVAVVPNPQPQPTLAQTILAAAEAAQVLQLHPTAALQRVITRDGFVPTSPERQLTFDGTRYAYQRAEHLSNGKVRGYYCLVGQWEQVQWVERGASGAAAVFETSRKYIGRATLGKNYSHRPAGAKVKGIILHHTGGTFTSSLNWLTNPSSGVGTHYLIDVDGSIYQLVEDNQAAWHAGNSILGGVEDCNDYTLGVELVNKGDGKTPYPLVQQAALLWLLRRKAAEYNIGRTWIATHKAVRANYMAKYPNDKETTAKPDPAGLDVAGLLEQVFAKQAA